MSIDSKKEVVLSLIRETWRTLPILWGSQDHGTRRVEVVGPCDTSDTQEEVNLHEDTAPLFGEEDYVECEDYCVSSRGMVEGVDLEDRQPKHNLLLVEDRDSIHAEAVVDRELPLDRHILDGPR